MARRPRTAREEPEKPQMSAPNMGIPYRSEWGMSSPVTALSLLQWTVSRHSPGKVERERRMASFLSSESSTWRVTTSSLKPYRLCVSYWNVLAGIGW
jgi:hypothetical protein